MVVVHPLFVLNRHPFSSILASKNGSKVVQKAASLFKGFLARSILEPKRRPRRPKSRPRRPKRRLRPPQDAPKAAQDAPKAAQDSPKAVQDTPKARQRSFLDVHELMVPFGSFLDEFQSLRHTFVPCTKKQGLAAEAEP